MKTCQAEFWRTQGGNQTIGTSKIRKWGLPHVTCLNWELHVLLGLWEQNSKYSDCSTGQSQSLSSHIKWRTSPSAITTQVLQGKNFRKERGHSRTLQGKLCPLKTQYTTSESHRKQLRCKSKRLHPQDKGKPECNDPILSPDNCR